MLDGLTLTGYVRVCPRAIFVASNDRQHHQRRLPCRPPEGLQGLDGFEEKHTEWLEGVNLNIRELFSGTCMQEDCTARKREQASNRLLIYSFV